MDYQARAAPGGSVEASQKAGHSALSRQTFGSCPIEARAIVIPLDGPDLTIVFGSDSECGLDAAMRMIQPVLDSLIISGG